MELGDFIDICINENQYFGLGNPKSRLLFVGKEVGLEAESEIVHGTGMSWKNKDNSYSKRFTPEDRKLKNGNHTWQKYQRLFDLIAERIDLENYEKNKDYEITFVEFVFTTELSNINSKSTNEAKGQPNFENELSKRKAIFWKSSFINKFDIVVIFASDNKYIECYDGEVQELFNVEYKNKIDFGSSQKIWINKSDDSSTRKVPRLVLHTRQLTNGCTNKLIEKLADLISKHILEYGIKVMPAANN